MTSREYVCRIRKAASRAASFTATLQLRYPRQCGAAGPQWTHPANSAWAARARQRGRRSKRMTIDRLPAPLERQRAHRVPAMIDRRARMSGFKATARLEAAEPGRRAVVAVGAVATRSNGR